MRHCEVIGRLLQAGHERHNGKYTMARRHSKNCCTSSTTEHLLLDGSPQQLGRLAAGIQPLLGGLRLRSDRRLLAAHCSHDCQADELSTGSWGRKVQRTC